MRAVVEYELTIQYLLSEWSESTALSFIDKIETQMNHLKNNPNAYPFYKESSKIRFVTVSKHTQIFYFVTEDLIRIITVWSTRRNPEWIDLE
jgi:plasmid stabilization system protein ParE